MKRLFEKIYFKIHEKEVDAYFDTLSIINIYIQSKSFDLEDCLNNDFYDDFMFGYACLAPIYETGRLNKNKLNFLKKSTVYFVKRFLVVLQ